MVCFFLIYMKDGYRLVWEYAFGRGTELVCVVVIQKKMLRVAIQCHVG